MDYLVIPDFVERKGSIYLRSNHMNYCRATLNSNWHQAREAEPKDYDINNFPKLPSRNLHTATYTRIGPDTGPRQYSTTTGDAQQQISLKDDFTEKETRKNMVDLGSFGHANIDRETNAPKRGFGAVLPRHNPDYDKLHLETTHRADFCAPYPYTPAEEKPAEFEDNSRAYRKCHSQFTDTADYRRSGKNTWQDESGVYANSEEKRRVFPKTSPYPERLVEGLN